MATENASPIGGFAWVFILMGISFGVMNWQSNSATMARLSDAEQALHLRLAEMERQANRRAEIMLLQLSSIKRHDELLEQRGDSLMEMFGLLRERQNRIEDRLTTLEKKRGVSGGWNSFYREFGI